ncbi:MAG TPA: methyltransferase domain-containing protein [Chitinophagaceae bacterium]|nr:methyltransferase domain-containing protein [Chitinophagaceae bacterium]
MQDDTFTDIPVQYDSILKVTKELNFNMSSDLYIGSLLKTLVAAKPGGRILELGTGSGLATSWIADGMDKYSKLVTVDNNELLISVAKKNLKDQRIEFVCADGYEWINEYKGSLFDVIFADAIPGKYDLFEETFALLRTGGFYIIDDMMQQPNWPEGHADKAETLIQNLEAREDIRLTKLNWSTGVIIAVKIVPGL